MIIVEVFGCFMVGWFLKLVVIFMRWILRREIRKFLFIFGKLLGRIEIVRFVNLLFFSIMVYCFVIGL